MYAVIDTNIIIDRQIDEHDFKRGFITPSVLNEIKNDEIKKYLDFHMYRIELKEPNEEYIQKVKNLQKEKNLNLSQADIDVIALTLEIKSDLNKEMIDKWVDKESIKHTVKCLTKDNGVLHCLRYFHEEVNISNREFAFRCASCFSLFFTKLDFCKKCASNLISRVSIRKENGKIKVFLKKGFIRKTKVLKDKYGNILRAADQKEYINYIRDLNKENRKNIF